MAKKPNGKDAEKKGVKLSKEQFEIAWILGALAILAVVFVAFYLIFSGSGKVHYQGLTFTKEQFGDIPVYHYSYISEAPGGQLFRYNLFVRNDPTKLKVPLEGKIIFPSDRRVFVGMNERALQECPQSSLAVAELSKFLTNNMIQVQGGLTNKSDAIARNISYIDCDEYPQNIVIIMDVGNETKVTKPAVNCHVIEAANCDILPATEKFIIQAIIDAKEIG